MTATRWRYETTLLVVLGLMFGIVFFDRNAMSYLTPFVAKDLGLSNTQIGMLASALSLTWALSAFAVGAYSDATGRRKSVLIVCIVIFSFCSLGSGLATSVCDADDLAAGDGPVRGRDPADLAVAARGRIERPAARTQHGCHAELRQQHPGLVRGAIDPRGRGEYVALARGVLRRRDTGPDLCACSWHATCARWHAMRDREPRPRTPRHRRHGPHRTNTATRSPWPRCLAQRNMWICVLLSCVMVAWMVLGWTFLPVYYVNARGISPSAMSVLMSLLGISAAVFSFIVSGLSDRLGRKPVMIAFCAIGALVPLAALHYHGPLAILGRCVFIGWSASGVFPIFMATIPSETISVRHVATATGVVVGIGEITGGFLSPTLAGRAADAYGLQAPMLIMVGCTRRCDGAGAVPARDGTVQDRRR